MEIVLVLLTGTVMGFLFFATYRYGYSEGLKAQKDETVNVTKDNIRAIKEINNWLNYDGRRE